MTHGGGVRELRLLQMRRAGADPFPLVIRSQTGRSINGAPLLADAVEKVLVVIGES